MLKFNKLKLQMRKQKIQMKIYKKYWNKICKKLTILKTKIFNIRNKKKD